ncbi:hypothetical protein COLO4_22642 [Corchorus olitorius]|uniref:Uncharacterized protein n=1 Tax=Corchorus olitorius TaxID=93759 RepID=A0A1R3IKU8_9ROSI|nr:hypothetical protein COLO4_22642 [Corchorus olitorius]
MAPSQRKKESVKPIEPRHNMKSVANKKEGKPKRKRAYVRNTDNKE